AATCPDSAPAAIHTRSLHDALPICAHPRDSSPSTRNLNNDRRYRIVLLTTFEESLSTPAVLYARTAKYHVPRLRSEMTYVERPGDRKSTTSELQSRENLVCRLLLEE